MVKKIVQDLRKDKFLMALLGAFLVFLVVYLFSLGLTNTVYADRAVMGLKINNISVGGKTKAEIETLLKQEIEDYKKGEIEISVGQNKYLQKISELEPQYKLDVVAEKAIKQGKGTLDFREFIGGQITVTPTFNKETFDKFYVKIAEKENTPFSNAVPKIENNKLTFTEEKRGKGVSEEVISKKITNLLATFGNLEEAKVEDLIPKITVKDLEEKRGEIELFLQKPLVIKADSISEKVPQSDLISWLDFEKKENGINLIIKEKTAAEFVKKLSPRINIIAVNATLSEKNGKAVIATPSIDGKKLDETKSILAITAKGVKQEEVMLPLVLTKPEIRQGNLKNLGIEDLVSTGTSNFSGSPANRIHNVRTGASKFNGILIKPDETFSFNKYLGEVDAANGYLPELVILQDKTEPQYGGGLCQVSSTVFRAALNAGMPIEARLNHAYPVSYYYPIGVDATIYLPNPDLKFKNDTSGHIYVQTLMYGNTLKFEFYGTKPARAVTFSGNENAVGAVSRVEDVTPYLFNRDAKGKGSLDSIFYRFIYDSKGNLIDKYRTLSKYDSPEKYPHPVAQ